MITAAQIKQFAPRAKPAIIEAIVSNWAAAEKIGLTTPLRIQHFMARVAVETRGLTALEESLTYTTFAALNKAWPSRFPTEASAAPYIRQPKKLAIKVYGGRLGNRPAPATDGWDNRGSGMLQSTGAENIKATGYTGEQLRQPVPAFLSALTEWKKRKCNALADRDDAVAVCKAIQGGTGGLADQKVYLAAARKVWPSDGTVATPAKPAKPLPPSAPAMTSFEIEALQRQLQAALYTEVGFIDGKWGSRTTAALAAFQADNKLEVTGAMDDATKAFIVENGIPKRVIPAARADATADSLREQGNLPASAQKAEKGVFWSKMQGAFGGLAALVYGLWSYVGTAISAVTPLKDDLGAIAPWLFFAVVIGFALLMYLRNGEAITEAVKAVRKGQDTGV